MLEKRSRMYCAASDVYILTFHSVFLNIKYSSIVDPRTDPFSEVGDERSIETFCSPFSDADAQAAWVPWNGIGSPRPQTVKSKVLHRKAILLLNDLLLNWP